MITPLSHHDPRRPQTWMIDWFSYGITWTLLPLAVRIGYIWIA
jgi:hypothetical protein